MTTRGPFLLVVPGVSAGRYGVLLQDRVGLVLVVVQLAMGQFSPRIVQRILQDKPSQFAIGLFVATFVHAILALREVTNEGDGTGQVPGIAVVTAFVLVVLSIAVLVIYVHHIGRSLRVSALIELVGKDTRELLDRVYRDKGTGFEGDGDGPRIVRARRSGVVTKIDFVNPHSWLYVAVESDDGTATEWGFELDAPPRLRRLGRPSRPGRRPTRSAAPAC